jgi:hypothetical protein
MDASSTGRRSDTWAWTLAGSAAVVTLIGLGYAFAGRHATQPENIGFRGYWAIIAFGSAASGLLLALRRPTNAIGWIFLAAAVLWGMVQLGDGYASWAVAGRGSTAVTARLAAASLDWIWVPAQACLGLVFVLFPDGRFLSRRWRAWTMVAGGATVLATLLNALIDPLSVYVRVDNPLGISGMDAVAEPALSALALLLVVGLANLVVRFRRSSGDERQQIKWLVPSSLVIAAAYLVYVFGFAIPGRDPTGFWIGVAEACLLMALATIPIPIAIAVLKYRLYDIDLVIRKTVVFGVLVALLLGVGAIVALLIGVGIVPSLSDAPGVLVLVGIVFGLFAIPCTASRRGSPIASSTRDARARTRSWLGSRVGSARRTRTTTCSPGWRPSCARGRAPTPRRSGCSWTTHSAPRLPRRRMRCRPECHRATRSRWCSTARCSAPSRSRCRRTTRSMLVARR